MIKLLKFLFPKTIKRLELESYQRGVNENSKTIRNNNSLIDYTKKRKLAKSNVIVIDKSGSVIRGRIASWNNNIPDIISTDTKERVIVVDGVVIPYTQERWRFIQTSNKDTLYSILKTSTQLK